MCSRVIDQNMAHHLRRDPEKMVTVLDVQTLVDHPQIGLVDE